MAIYLDHNATTRPAPEVVEEMAACMRDAFGNPSSAHSFGRAARRVLDEARSRVAGLLGALPDEIVFTSGGTEADGLALRGVLEACAERGRRGIVTTEIEHPAVLETCRDLEKRGFPPVFVPVDAEGRVRVETLEETIDDATAVVSLMLANNETGALQPVAQAAAIARRHGALCHTDAVQAPGKIPVDVRSLGIDLLSISSHKLYGPKGVGALFVRRGTPLSAVQLGGSQEGHRRGGTENLPGIAGLGRACQLAAERLSARSAELRSLRDRLEKGTFERIPDARRNGPAQERLPNTLNVTLPGLDGEKLMLLLDRAGIAVSTGAACHSANRRPSSVLLAMGLTSEEAHGSLRLSLGEGNTAQEVDRVVDELASVVARLREGRE